MHYANVKRPGVKPKIEVKLPPETIKRQKITVTEIRIVSISRFILGRGDGIRTHDLLVPNQARYHLRYASYPPIIVFFLPSVNQKSICNRNKLFRFCAYCRSLIPRYGCKPQKLSRFGAKYGVFCDYPHRLIKYVNIVAIRVKVWYNIIALIKFKFMEESV